MSRTSLLHTRKKITTLFALFLQFVGSQMAFCPFLIGKEAGIVTDSNYGEAKPLIDTTRLRVSHKLEPLLKEGIVPVVTGFIGADQNGNVTTVGRGGSDYSATIIASAIAADEVWLWSDVDGLMTADPKLSSAASVLKEVSFSEAMEMALYGAK